MEFKDDLRKADEHIEEADRLLRSVARDAVEVTEENLHASSKVNVHNGTIRVDISHQVTIDKLNTNLPHPYIAKETEKGGIEIEPLEETFDPDTATWEESKSIKELISIIEESTANGAPEAVVVRYATKAGFEEGAIWQEINELKQKGEIYEPTAKHLRTT